MDRIKVMLADGSPALLRGIGDYLARRGELVLTGRISDGAEVLPAVLSDLPDVLVMDLILPRRDGFEILEQLSRLDEGCRPRVLVLTSLARDELILRAVRLGAAYYMVKPFDPALLCERILELAHPSENAEPEPIALSETAEAAGSRITNLFLTLGIPAHIRGYQYLREAVLMVLEDHSLLNSITKELYPGVAKRFGASASKVERAMRHAIEVAWNRGRLDSANRIYGYQVFEKQDKPSNGEFIAMVADRISMKETA